MSDAPVLRAADLPMFAKKQQSDMLRRGLSPRTVGIYDWGVQTLIKYVAESGAQVVDREVLEGWQDSLMSRLSVKSRSVAATGVHPVAQVGGGPRTAPL